jgi:hypothetical protein
LSADAQPPAQQAALHVLHGLYTVGEEGDSSDLDEGVALSPYYAAECIFDGRRTLAFVGAVDRAIESALTRVDGTIELFYLGCGPLATLLLPSLVTRADESRLRVTLVDVHQESVDALRVLLDHLDLRGPEVSVHTGDAMFFDTTVAPDVLVMEVLQHGLTDEPQVGMTLRWVPRLAEGGQLIPGAIEIDAWLVDAKDPKGSDRVELGAVMRLDAEYGRTVKAQFDRLPCPSFEVGAIPWDEAQLLITTRLVLDDKDTLVEGDCGLSDPRLLDRLGKVRTGDRIEIEYRLGGRPAFEATRSTP